MMNSSGGRLGRFVAAFVASVLGLGVFAGAAGANVGDPITLSTDGSNPQVAVDSNGTAHIVWDGQGPEAGYLEYCQIPAGGSACIDAQSFLTPNYASGAHVLLGPAPGEVVLLNTMYGPIGWTYVNAWVSMDGGHTFSSPVIGGGYSSQGGTDQMFLPSGQPVFGPGGFSASWMDQKGYFENFPINSGPSPTALCDPMDPTGGVGCGPPAVSTDTRLFTTCGDPGLSSIALLNDTTPVAACDGDNGTLYYRVATGVGDLNDVSTGSWGPVQQHTVSGGAIGLPWLVGGPRGVYLLFSSNRTAESNGDAEVSKLTNGTFGSPTTVAPNTIPEAMSEDATGNLFAVTTDTAFGGNGAQQRVFTSPDGVHWTEVRLHLGGVNAANANAAVHIAGCAVAGASSTGSGFVVFNSPTSSAPNAIDAESFGSAPCGGSQGSSNCPTHLTVGVAQLIATDGCFAAKGHGTYTTADQVELNGIMIQPGSELVIDTVNRTLVDKGVALVRTSSVTLGKQALDWLLPGAPGTIDDLAHNGLPVSFDPAAAGGKLLGFAISGLVTPTLEQAGEAALPVNVQMPSPIGSLLGPPPTDDVNLTTGNLILGGLSLSPGSVDIKLPEVSLGIASLAPFEIKYDSDPEVFDGHIGLQLPGLSSGIDSQWEFEQGRFVYGRATVNFGMTFPIYPDVFLQKVAIDVAGERGNVCANPPTPSDGPTQIGGGVTIALGPITGNDPLFEVDGNASYTFPESRCNAPGVFAITGSGKMLGVPVANAHATFATNGNIGLGASVSFGDHTLGLFASFDGAIGAYKPFPFYATGSATAYVGGIGFGPSLTVSSIGIGGCLAPIGYVEYKWHGGFSGGPTLVCGSSDLIPPGLGTAARAASGAQTITVPQHDPFEVIELRSSAGVPLVALNGPHGQTFTTPALSAGQPGRLTVTSRADSFSVLGDDTTMIKLIGPAAGRWTIRPLPGSPPVTTLLTAHGLPVTSIHARVTRGAGRLRYLAYTDVPAPGRAITLFETGAGHVMRVIAVIHGPSGTIPFLPSSGPGGQRSIDAQVTDHGLADGKPFRVATYVAPGPPQLGQPGHLAVTRQGSRIEISWARVPLAARYAVRAVLSDGRSPLILVGGSAHSVTVPAVQRDDSGHVMVAALDAQNRLGPVANITFHAGAPSCAHPHAVRGRLVCAGPKPKKGHGHTR